MSHTRTDTHERTQDAPRGIDESEKRHPVGVFWVVAVVVAVSVAVVVAVPPAPTGLLVVVPTSHGGSIDDRLPLELAPACLLSQLSWSANETGHESFGERLSRTFTRSFSQDQSFCFD